MNWRNRSLLGLVVAELVSLTGSSMTFVALPWFVLVTTGSIAKMGWVMAAEMLPIALFGIPSGALIARLGAKKTMVISDAARGPLLMVLPILKWTGNLSFGWVLVVDVRDRLLRGAVLLVLEADHPGGRRRRRAGGRAGERRARRGEPDHADRRARARRRPHRRDEPARRARRRRRDVSLLRAHHRLRRARRASASSRRRSRAGCSPGCASSRTTGCSARSSLAACGINLVAQGLIVAVQGLAYFRLLAGRARRRLPLRRVRDRRAARRDRGAAADAEGRPPEARGRGDRRRCRCRSGCWRFRCRGRRRWSCSPASASSRRS